MGMTLLAVFVVHAAGEAFQIVASGDAGLGTATPVEEFHILRSDDDDVFISIESEALTEQNVGFNLVNSAATWNFFANSQGRFRVAKGGLGAVLDAFSDGDITVRNNLTVDGDLNVTGTKNFAVADPRDDNRWLYYSALEGPEAGTYFRGTARIVDGEAVIELPDHFAAMTETEGLTVQLTPLEGWHKLYVADKSPEQLIVRDADGESGAEFDYFVQGVRTGHSDFEVVRSAPH